MAVISTTKILKADVLWDEEWANRPDSGAGYRWKILPSTGVTIDDPTAPQIMATFQNAGTYTAYLGVSDGAMPAFAKTTFTVEEGSIEVPISDDSDVTVPVSVTLPSGSAIYDMLDCMIDIDTTGSMGGVISTAKSQAASIVSALLSSGRNVRCGVADFRDVGDAWVNMIRCGLTSDFSSIQSALNAMSASGGGDANEAQIPSLYRTILNSPWRDGALRVYIQMTDIGAHDPRDGVSSSQAYAAVKDNNIKFIGIGCSSSSWLQTCANAVGGKYYSLDTSASTIVSTLLSALDDMSKNLTVELVRGTGTGTALVKDITPTTHTNVNPGDTFSFDVTFNRSGLASLGEHGTQTYEFTLNVRTATDLAILDTIPVAVKVTW